MRLKFNMNSFFRTKNQVEPCNMVFLIKDAISYRAYFFRVHISHKLMMIYSKGNCHSTVFCKKQKVAVRIYHLFCNIFRKNRKNIYFFLQIFESKRDFSIFLKSLWFPKTPYLVHTVYIVWLFLTLN